MSGWKPVQWCGLFDLSLPSAKAEKECCDASDKRKCLHCIHREVLAEGPRREEEKCD